MTFAIWFAAQIIAMFIGAMVEIDSITFHRDREPPSKARFKIAHLLFPGLYVGHRIPYVYRKIKNLLNRDLIKKKEKK